MFKRRNSSGKDRYRGGSGGNGGVFGKGEFKVPHRASLVTQRRTRHVGKRKEETLWDLLKSLFPKKKRRSAHVSHNRGGDGGFSLPFLPQKRMKNYKARGHKVFASGKNPFRFAKPKVRSHSGRRRSLGGNAVTGEGVIRGRHQGKKKRKNKLTASPLAHTPYRPSGKKYHIKSVTAPLVAKSGYRSGKKKYKVKAKVTGQSSSYGGSRAHKHKAHIKMVTSNAYRSGKTGRKYKNKVQKVPSSAYRSGKTGRKYKVKEKNHKPSHYSGSSNNKHKSKIKKELSSGYRSGKKGKKYRIKEKPLAPSGYRSGAAGKKYKAHMKTISTPVYRSGLGGKKYRVKAKAHSVSNYRGGSKKSMGDVRVVVGKPYRSGGASGNRRKKAHAMKEHRPYRRGNQVHKYKVKATSKVRPEKRKHNATAARTKKLSYLQKNTKGKKRKSSEKGAYSGHLSLNHFLRIIVLVLTILVTISLVILALTKDEWMPETQNNTMELARTAEFDKKIFENMKEL